MKRAMLAAALVAVSLQSVTVDAALPKPCKEGEEMVLDDDAQFFCTVCLGQCREWCHCEKIASKPGDHAPNPPNPLP